MAAPHPLLVPLIAGDPVPDGAEVTADVVESAEEHGVAALLDDAVTGAGVAISTPQMKQRLAMRRLEAAAENHAALTAVAEVLEAAAALDIEVAVAKGVAVGSRLYRDPDLRPTIDVDVFVAPHSLDRIGDLALALGASALDKEAIDAMVAEGRVFEVTLTTSGADIDLHRDPMNMVLPSARERDRWDRTTTVALTDGTKVRTLDLEDTIILALLHLFRDNFATLLHVNDVRLMMEAGPDWDEVERRAAADGWTDIVRYATWFVASTFGLDSPLPTTIARWRKAVIDTVWPPSLLLHGADSIVRSQRRQSALSLLALDRPGALAGAYARRVIPPRAVIDLRAGPSDRSYPVALADWRLRQRRENRASIDDDGDPT
jgi:hypothetical protein